MTQKQSMKVLTSSLTNEWFTPPEYIEAARAVLGEIGYDPASSDLAQKIVRARYFSTLENDDPLDAVWGLGNIFLNPPYGKTGGKSNSEIWARKLLTEYALGHFGEAILLTKDALGYAWCDWLFHDVVPTACITKDRIAFVKPEWVKDDGSIVYPKGQPKRSKTASIFWYIGEDDGKFAEIFKKFGRIIPGICTRIH